MLHESGRLSAPKKRIRVNTQILALVALCLYGCHHNGSTKDTPKEDGGPDSPCGRMCQHFRDLECEEGKSIYDSDLPGPVGEPNLTCEMFCRSQTNLGVDLNPECSAKAPTCEEIEAYRAMMSCS